MPYVSRELEILCAIMYREGFQHYAMNHIEPEYFQDIKQQNIFKVMREMYSKELPLSFPSIVEYSGMKPEELIHVVNHDIYPGNIEHTVDNLRNSFLERKINSLMVEIQKTNGAKKMELLAEVDKLREDMMAKHNDGMVQLKTIAEQGVNRCLDDIVWIKTGIEALDNVIHGIKGTQVFVIGAEPGCGKTTMAWQIASNVGNAVFFSTEMTAQELYIKALSLTAEVNSINIERNQMTKAEEIKVKKAEEKIKQSDIVVYDKNFSYYELLSKIKYEMKRGASIIVFDYIQNIIGAPGNSENERLTEITNTFKNLALNNRVPIIAISQLTKESYANQGRPGLGSLRGSGAIGQNADTVLMLYKNFEKNQKGDVVVRIVKGRSLDPGGIIPGMRFVGKWSKFVSEGVKSFNDATPIEIEEY